MVALATCAAVSLSFDDESWEEAVHPAATKSVNDLDIDPTSSLGTEELMQGGWGRTVNLIQTDDAFKEKCELYIDKDFKAHSEKAFT